MPTDPSARALRDAVALAAICGCRTFTGPAALALRGRWGAGPVMRIVPLAAAGELLADKHPAMRPRTDPPAWLGRIVSGAVSGAALAGSRGAGVGAVSAAVVTPVSARLRAAVGDRTGIPDVILGAVEDALAISVSVWVTRSVATRAPGPAA